MKYLTGFIILAYLGGLLFWKTNPRVRAALLFGLCLLLTVAFYFFDKL